MSNTSPYQEGRKPSSKAPAGHPGYGLPHLLESYSPSEYTAHSLVEVGEQNPMSLVTRGVCPILAQFLLGKQVQLADQAEETVWRESLKISCIPLWGRILKAPSVCRES